MTGAVWTVLLLILVANAAPVLARDLLGDSWSAPVDLGRHLPDGRRLFGDAKTWRGVIAGLAAAGALAPLLGTAPSLGLLAGALAMIGDLAASFLKRRLALRPSSRAPLLDTVPEALLPALGLAGPLDLRALDVAALVVLFTLVDTLASPLLFRLRLRRRPW